MSGHAANAYHNAAINVLNRALRGEEARQRRSTPLLDGEGNALAPDEPSTPSGPAGVNPPNGPPEIHLSSGGAGGSLDANESSQEEDVKGQIGSIPLSAPAPRASSGTRRHAPPAQGGRYAWRAGPT